MAEVDELDLNNSSGTGNEIRKSNIKPTEICEYGENCDRKDAIHFTEFAHKHLDSIYDNGLDSSNKYKIPQELSMSKDIIEIQLKLIENLFPNLSINATSDKSKAKIRSLSCPPKIGATTIGRKSHNRLSSSTSDIYSKINKNYNDIIPVVLPKGQAAKKLSDAAPYNFFLTAVTDSPLTHNEPLTITFLEILDKSLGEIECSVQICFLIDVDWVLYHYNIAGCLNTPLLILYGRETPELLNISKHAPQVTATKIRMFSPFGTHHTKMMLLGYKDGSMRVVISTANLTEYDWDNQTQGIWISPKLNSLARNVNVSDGESQTGFRQNLLSYLEEYKDRNLQSWITRIRNTDFTSINVFLIASVPGRYRKSSSGDYPWGHPQLGKILSKHSAKINADVPIVAQSSSVGSMGRNERIWLQNDFITSLCKGTSPIGLQWLPEFKMIYPSCNNVKNSHDGLEFGGFNLSYTKTTSEKQPWLRHYLYQWISNKRYRSKAMPHIKTYCRWSEKGLYWFVLTSGNLSRVAWGIIVKERNVMPTLNITNYEVGVVFLPKLIIAKDTFPLNTNRDENPAFPMPYNIPLTPYASEDVPLIKDDC